MACFGRVIDDLEAVDKCDECGGDINEDGNSIDACEYSPVECEKCGLAPCDLSC